jgi:hypothetical protein
MNSKKFVRIEQAFEDFLNKPYLQETQLKYLNILNDAFNAEPFSFCNDLEQINECITNTIILHKLHENHMFIASQNRIKFDNNLYKKSYFEHCNRIKWFSYDFFEFLKKILSDKMV